MSRVFDNNTANRFDILPAQAAISLATMGTHSLAAWIKPANITTEMSICGCSSTSGIGALLRINSDANNGRLAYFVTNSGASGVEATKNACIDANVWQAVIATWDGTNLNVYDDGGVGTAAALSALDGGHTGDWKWGVRNNGGGVSFPFNGRIAWLSIWDVVLSSTDRSNFMAGVNPRNIGSPLAVWDGQNSAAGDETDLVSSYVMDEVGVVAYDGADNPSVSAYSPPIKGGSLWGLGGIAGQASGRRRR